MSTLTQVRSLRHCHCYSAVTTTPRHELGSFVGPFKNKGAVLTDIMRQISRHTDFLVPLDSDEFIVLERRASQPSDSPDGSRDREPGFSADPWIVRREFDTLPYDGRKYRFRLRDGACPADDDRATATRRRALVRPFFYTCAVD